MPETQPLDLASLWRVVLAEIELSVSKANFTIWFKNTTLTQRAGDTVTVAAPNIFTREWLENKYSAVVLGALQHVDPTIRAVRYELVSRPANAPAAAPGFRHVVMTKRAVTDIVPPSAQSASFPAGSGAAPGRAPAAASAQWDATSNLNLRYTFENFIVGASNELAYAAAQAVARRPGEAYNPLFIYGGTGLGKTHLLQAIGNAIVRRGGGLVRYVPLEKFMQELIAAIQNKATQPFKERYRTVDVLIVDDVQAIVGKEKTQDEFFHTFNELHGAGKQMVLSSDRPPKALSALEERLRSRFEGGMTADIGQPDFETRVAILREKCAQRGTAVPEEALQYIAAQVSSNIRELEGLLNRVVAHCELRGGSPTLAVTREILAGVLARPKQRIIHTARLIEAVCTYYQVEVREVVGESRRKEVVRPRQVAMYLLRSENGFSYPTIGHSFGGKDHTTVMHACEKIGNSLHTDEELRQDVLAIKQKLYVSVGV